MKEDRIALTQANKIEALENDNKNLHKLVAELHKEVVKLKQVKDEVLTIWNEDGGGGEIQMRTPIAWYRAIILAEKIN